MGGLNVAITTTRPCGEGGGGDEHRHGHVAHAAVRRGPSAVGTAQPLGRPGTSRYAEVQRVKQSGPWAATGPGGCAAQGNVTGHHAARQRRTV